MKRSFFFLIHLLLPLFLLSAVPGVQTAETTEPGGVLPVYLDDADYAARGGITFSDGRRVYASGFVLSVEQGTSATVLLFGIPCNVASGEAALEITGGDSGGEYRLEKALMVAARDFKEETIPLTEFLTRLRQEEKEKRDRESREMYSILVTFRPDAVFDTGPYILPVTGGRETSWFGDRRTYTYPDGGTGGSIHSGIDLAAPEGTAVYSSGAGRVVFSGPRIITGETVVVEHLPGVYCLYYHLEDRFAKVGEQVYRGQVIGTVGMTGFATGPHLHWEFRVGGVPVDPAPLTGRGILDKEEILGMIGVED